MVRRCLVAGPLGLLADVSLAVSADNGYVEVSSDTPGVVEVVPVGMDFHITTANVSDAFKATVTVSSVPGWDLRSPNPATFEMAIGGNRGYEGRNQNNEEDKAGGNIILFKVDVEIDGVGEDKEETEGAFVGYADCANGFDPACVAAMKPVRIRCMPAKRPDGERLVLTFPSGHSLEKIGTTYQAAQSSYKANEIGDKSFWLHGHAASGAERDRAIKAEHNINRCKDEAKYTVLRVGMTAYRPTTEGPAYATPFPKTAVPEDQEETPGTGIRTNGDDDNNNSTADRDDTTVNNENDLIEVELKAEPYPTPSGLTYVLKRNNTNIRVWDSQTKGTAILNSGTETAITFSAATRTVWVEAPSGGNADLDLVARPGSTDICSDKVHFYSFQTVVVGLSGEIWLGGDPLVSGMYNVAQELYGRGYDIHYYDEDVVAADGAGAAYNEVVSAIQNRGVSRVAIYGHSHGGGSTHDLAERLDNNRATIGTFTTPATAYVDAIENDSDFDMDSELHLPPATQAHLNYYQPNGMLHGGGVTGAQNLDVTTTQWGQNLDHATIDNDANVINAVRDHVLQVQPKAKEGINDEDRSNEHFASWGNGERLCCPDQRLRAPGCSHAGDHRTRHEAVVPSTDRCGCIPGCPNLGAEGHKRNATRRTGAVLPAARHYHRRAGIWCDNPRQQTAGGSSTES